MGTMDKSLFKGGDIIVINDLGRLETRNYSDGVDEALKLFKWSGRPAGCVVLNLNADNSAVAGGQFVARGKLAKNEIKLEANKLWEVTDNSLTLTMQVPDAGAFTFGEGGLCSDYMESDNLEYCVTTSGRNAQVVLASDYSSRGIGVCCIRLVCSIAKASPRYGITLGYSILIFPGSADQICEVSELTSSPSWPGLELAKGEMSLLPLPSEPWRCPVLPLLLTGEPWADEVTHPPFEELREKVAWVMSTSEPPETCKTRKALLARWQKLANSPDDFSPKKSPLVWPTPSQPTYTGQS
jgi:hypothetical protein